MFGNWLKRKVQLAGVRAATEDLSRFVTSLQGQGADELAMVIAIATILRLRLRDEGHLPDQALGVGLPLPDGEQASIQLQMANWVRLFQREGQLTDAAGTMVWLHTLRAFAYPEVRLLGRAMWKELSRGMAQAEEALEHIAAMTGRPIPVGAMTEYRFIPPGLEPFDT